MALIYEPKTWADAFRLNNFSFSGDSGDFDNRTNLNARGEPMGQGSAQAPGSVGPGAPAPSAPSWVAQNPFAAPGATPPPTGYNLNPTPTSGAGVFGAVPGQLGLPDPGGDLAKRIPGLAGLNSAASANIAAQLGGELPQDVLNQIQDAAARFGVASGMPGSGLAGNRSLRDVGLNSLQQQQAGLGNLNAFSSQVSGTQTLSPALQAEIASQNAINAAAPDPSLAGGYAKSLYDQYLASVGRGGGGGTTTISGGTSRVMPPQSFAPFYSGFSSGNRQTTNGMPGSGYDYNGYPIQSGGYGYSSSGYGGANGYGAASPATGYTDYNDYGVGMPGDFGPASGTMTNDLSNPFGQPLDQSFWGQDMSYNPWLGEDEYLADPGLFNNGYDLWSNP
jgi:hypothetical protein